MQTFPVNKMRWNISRKMVIILAMPQRVKHKSSHEPWSALDLPDGVCNLSPSDSQSIREETLDQAHVTSITLHTSLKS